MNNTNWNLHHFTCSRCKRELVPSYVEAAGGAADETSITLRHLPCLACPDGHEKAPTSPDFAENLLEALFADGGIPVARHKGLLRKTSVCPRCAHELPQQPQSRLFSTALRLRQPGVKYEVEFDHVDARQPAGNDPAQFSVELKIPALTCGKCATQMAASTAQLAEALAAALDSSLPAGR